MPSKSALYSCRRRVDAIKQEDVILQDLAKDGLITKIRLVMSIRIK